MESGIIFRYFFDYFWIAGIVTTLVYAYQIKHRIEKYIKERPERKPVYNVLLRGVWLGMNIPWLVMGIGVVSGMVPTGSAYFDKVRNGNPFVLGWYGIILILWLLGCFWLVFKGGAEKLVEYPGFFQPEIKNPIIIKIAGIFCLLGAIVGMAILWVNNPSFQ